MPSTMNLYTVSKLSRGLLWTLFFILFPTALFFIFINKTVILEWELFNPISAPIAFNLILDPFGLLLSAAVIFISANVLYFSTSYIQGDEYVTRFTHLVLLFVLSINILIFIPHLIIILLGWDGLGLVSFLLVIYYQNPKSLAAGIITALTNRIGDVLILLSIGWIINQGHWNILYMWDNQNFGYVAFSLTIAAITKRAQIPFSSWLPAAIAAPTPVSALVHSSTLVTAGVFLLFRFYNFLHQMEWFNPFILFIARITIFMAGLSAIAECDIKKIVALSTLSQLGVMIARLGLNLPTLAFFHLITHALFKALLFLCVGSLIHLHSHSQDLRTMGLISSQIPIVGSSLLIANLALIGTPFLAGFYSKDIILEMSLFNPTNFIILLIFFRATGLTAAYSVRIILVGVWRPQRSFPLHSINDEDRNISFPCFNLSIGAIIGGRIINWISFYPIPEPTLPLVFKLMALIFTIFGGLMSIYIASTSPHLSTLLSSIITHNALCLMWFLTPLSSQGLIKIPLLTAHKFSKLLDQGWNETSGGQGAHFIFISTTKTLQPVQRNIINVHLLLSFFLILLLIYLL